MKALSNLLYLATFTLCLTTGGLAENHRGKVDTDGILSAGEIPNSHINYHDHGRHNGHGKPSVSEPHRGQMDTDGILSKGEIPNPRIRHGYGAPMSEPHRGEVDSDGILSPGEISNPLIDYGYRQDPHWYHDHDWDHRWDNYDYGYWRRYPERRWWGDEDRYWRGDDSFSEELHDGVRSGRLSRGEEIELRGMRADLLRREQDYWSDGHLSKHEREDLEDRADDLRKKFHHELNDGEYRR